MTETLYLDGENGKSFIRAILYMAFAEVALTLQDILIQFFISKHLGVDGLTAFGLVYPILVLMINICTFVVVGVHTVCSRDMGARNTDMARTHLGAGLTWGFMLMTLYAVLCNLFNRPLIMALGGAEVSEPLVEMAMDVLGFGTLMGPGYCTICIALTFLYFDRDRKRAIALSVMSIVTQCVTIAVFSHFFPTMQGVILGSVSGIYLTMAVILFNFNHRRDDTEDPFSNLRPIFDFRHVRLSFITGLPQLSAGAFYAVLVIVRNIFILSIGAREAVGVASLSEGISEVGEVLAGSVNRAVLAIVGAGYGSGSLKKYQQSVGMVFRQSVAIAFVSGMIQAAVMLPMIRIMLHGESDSVRQMAVIALISSSMSLVFYLLNNVFIGTYEATGRLRFAHVNYLLDYFVFPIGLMVLLGKCFGINGV